MGSSIILCEGETDQALLGCYLEKTAGWSFAKDQKADLFPLEQVVWYKDGHNNLKGIWQVGGNDFTDAVQKVLDRELLEHQFDHLVIVTDNDDSAEVRERLQEVLKTVAAVSRGCKLGEECEENQWGSFIIENSFSRSEIQFLYLLVPMQETGALETFMMNSLSEQSEEKRNVIDQSKVFVKGFQSDCYLKQRREKVKAELGVSLSVFSPDRIFTTMKELIDSVEWERFSTTHEQFELLKQVY